MISSVFRYCIAILFCLVSSGLAKSDTDLVASYVPVNDPVYDFLEDCAVHGLIPLSFITIKPLTRTDIAKVIQHVALDYYSIDDAVLKADVRFYLREYGWDIERTFVKKDIEAQPDGSPGYNAVNDILAPHRHLSMLRDTEYEFVLDPLMRFRVDLNTEDDTEANANVIRRAWGIQFRGAIKCAFGFYFRFVDNTEQGNGPYIYRNQLLEDRYGYVGPLLGGSETYYDMTEAALSTNWRMFDFVFGKDRVAWGPGDENLMLSGNAPSYEQFRMRIKLGKYFRLSYIVGKLHPWPAGGDTLYVSPEGWTRVLPSNKWLVAHRLDYFYKDWAVLGLSEALIWGDRGLEPAYINPLNFMYSAEHNSGDIDNVLLAADLTLRAGNLGIAYATILVDDMKTTTLGEGYPGNKLGYTAGVKVNSLGLDGLQTSAEYVRLDPFVYSHFYSVNRYTNWNANLGSSLKPNSDRFRWLVHYRPVRNLSCKVSISWNRHADVGGEVEQAVVRNGEGTAFFLEGNRTEWTEINTTINWECYPGAIIEGGWIHGAESTTIPNRLFIGLRYRY